MGDNLVIVAIPAATDNIWKISSEKIPHLTLLFLGDANNPNTNRIFQFVHHAVTFGEHGPFMLRVDRRDILGADEADVIHFEKNDWSAKWVNEFRLQLLKNPDIKAAYDSTEQFPEWQPHLTLGYPETPAHEDKNEHGIHWVDFDRIAVWTGNYEGPEFRLRWPDRESYDPVNVAWSAVKESGEVAVEELLLLDNKIAPPEPLHDAATMRHMHNLGIQYLTHAGVKGMHWGVRNSSRPAPVAVAPKAVSKVPHGDKKKTKIEAEGGENHPASEDAIKVAQARVKLQKSGPAALSNKELQDVANRVELEARVKRAVQPSGKKFVTKLLRNQGEQGANQFVSKQVRNKLALG